MAAEEHGDPQVSHWTVAPPTSGTGGLLTPPLSSGLAVEMKEGRAPASKPSPVTAWIGKEGARRRREDALCGLSQDQAEAVKPEEKKVDPEKNVPEDAFRAVTHAPVLSIYLLRGLKQQPGSSKLGYRHGLVLPALALHVPGIRDPNGAT